MRVATDHDRSFWLTVTDKRKHFKTSVANASETVSRRSGPGGRNGRRRTRL